MDILERIKNVIVKNLIETKITGNKPRRVKPSVAARAQSERLKQGEKSGEASQGTAHRYQQEYIKKRLGEQ